MILAVGLSHMAFIMLMYVTFIPTFVESFFCFFGFFLAALGLHGCARAFSSCGEQGLLFIALHGLLIAVTSLVAEHGL